MVPALSPLISTAISVAKLNNLRELFFSFSLQAYKVPFLASTEPLPKGPDLFVAMFRCQDCRVFEAGTSGTGGG